MPPDSWVKVAIPDLRDDTHGFPGKAGDAFVSFQVPKNRSGACACVTRYPPLNVRVVSHFFPWLVGGIQKTTLPHELDLSAGGRVAQITLRLTQKSSRGCPIQGREATLSGGFRLCHDEPTGVHPTHRTK